MDWVSSIEDDQPIHPGSVMPSALHSFVAALHLTICELGHVLFARQDSAARRYTDVHHCLLAESRSR